MIHSFWHHLTLSFCDGVSISPQMHNPGFLSWLDVSSPGLQWHFSFFYCLSGNHVDQSKGWIYLLLAFVILLNFFHWYRHFHQNKFSCEQDMNVTTTHTLPHVDCNKSWALTPRVAWGMASIGIEGGWKLIKDHCTKHAIRTTTHASYYLVL